MQIKCGIDASFSYEGHKKLSVAVKCLKNLGERNKEKVHRLKNTNDLTQSGCTQNQLLFTGWVQVFDNHFLDVT